MTEPDDELLAHMSCECCLKEPAVGVASVPYIPMSIAWGRKCLEAGVIPYGLAVANTAMIGGYVEGNEGWREIVDRTLTYFEKTREQFDADVAAEIRDQDAAMRKMEADEAAERSETPDNPS